jgi:hypothetical protein
MASIHQRGTLLWLFYCGLPRAGTPQDMLWRTRVQVTRSEATVERWMGAADSEIDSEEERAGGGPGPTGGGPEQEDRGRIRADDVYPECWRSNH